MKHHPTPAAKRAKASNHLNATQRGRATHRGRATQSARTHPAPALRSFEDAFLDNLKHLSEDDQMQMMQTLLGPPPGASGTAAPIAFPAPEEAAPPLESQHSEALLALLGDSFPFHDANLTPYLRLDLPRPAAATEGASAPPTAATALPAEALPAMPPALADLLNAEAGTRVMPLTQVRAFLIRLCRAACGEPPPEAVLREAMATLYARALAPERRRLMHHRFASARGAFWLDLGDARGRAVRLSAQGWEVSPPSAIYFHRHHHQLALPEPVRRSPGGDPLTLFYDFLPLRGNDALLWLAWMTACLNTTIARPMLCLIGPPGSGKTTLARFSRRLLDPSMLEIVPLGGETALEAVLARHALPIFDNVSHLSVRQSDTLCRAVTGAGTVRRRKNGDQVVEWFRVPLILTALELPALAADWLDRALVLPLAPPQNAGALAWREESAYWAAFVPRQPLLLGALCDLFCAALARYNPGFGRRPAAAWRMADFAAWGDAVMQALQAPLEGGFDALLKQHLARKNQIATDDDPLAQSLLELLERQPKWEGTVQALYKQLRLPGLRNVYFLGHGLRRLQPIMATQGISFSFQRSHGRRILTIERQYKNQSK